MKREIWRNYPVIERAALVADLLDRGVLAEGRRASKQPGRCRASGCELPKPFEGAGLRSLDRAAQ
jgi:4-hydroxybutyryl-CoA dehydratase/vinylacetyl-CoA-Delta-isomerase